MEAIMNTVSVILILFAIAIVWFMGWDLYKSIKEEQEELEAYDRERYANELRKNMERWNEKK
jgi:Tfp pilus assembly protein PilO